MRLQTGVLLINNNGLIPGLLIDGRERCGGYVRKDQGASNISYVGSGER